MGRVLRMLFALVALGAVASAWTSLRAPAARPLLAARETPPPVEALVEALPLARPLPPTVNAAPLEATPGRLSGIVADADGASIAGAVVRLTPEYGDDRCDQTTTDSAGRFSFDSVDEGPYRLDANLGARQSAPIGIGVDRGERLDGLVLELGAAVAEPIEAADGNDRDDEQPRENTDNERPGYTVEIIDGRRVIRIDEIIF